MRAQHNPSRLWQKGSSMSTWFMDCHGTTFAHFTQKKRHFNDGESGGGPRLLTSKRPSIRALIATFDDDFKVASNESTFPIGKISREKKIRSMKFIGNSNLIYFPGLHEIFVLWFRVLLSLLGHNSAARRSFCWMRACDDNDWISWQ